MKTKRKLEKEIEIPEKIEVSLADSVLKVKGPKGLAEKRLHHPRISIIIHDKSIKINSKERKPSKKDKTLINSFRAHILNLIKGAQEGYEYNLKICSGHFPMSVNVEGDKVIIKNFMGEKVPRKAIIMKGADVKVAGDLITITGTNKEIVSQTAARIEQATRITKRDRRVFQDGCYITSKAGKKI